MRLKRAFVRTNLRSAETKPRGRGTRMPSKAREAFDQNAKDVERLLELHSQKGGSKPGRRYGLGVLNKSAIVLITSFWEAYCEDIAAEALAHIVAHAKSGKTLPTELKKTVASEIKKALNQIEMWELADDGWRQFLTSRLEGLKTERDRNLNTPKADHIDRLFLDAIGIERISDAWKWSKKMTVNRAREKLDRFVSLRGDIAHRGKALKGVTKAQVVT